MTGRRRTPEKLRILVGRDAAGAVYELDPLSESRVQEAFPEAQGLPQVILGYRHEGEFQTLHGPHWPVVGTLLTGLTLEQIRQLGGMRLYSPREKAVVWDWPTATAKTG